MAQVKVTVCDVCERVDRPTARYRITNSDRRASVELCEEHAAPLEELLSRHAAPRKEYTYFEDTLATMEEIEEMKRREQGS